MTVTPCTPLPDYPWVRLLVADNPGVMTGDGTNTWLLGDPATGVLVVDPGPDVASHTAALRAALAQTPVVAVLVTHHHLDHSGALPEFLRDHPHATSRAVDPVFCHDAQPFEAGLGAGPHHWAATPGIALAVAPTPGHTADSVSALVTGPDGRCVLLSGDTVLGRGSSVIAHPGGCVSDYLVSLGRLLQLANTPAIGQVTDTDETRAAGNNPAPDGATGEAVVPLLPGHGPSHPDARPVITDYLTHRVRRLAEVAVAAHVETGPGPAPVTTTTPGYVERPADAETGGVAEPATQPGDAMVSPRTLTDTTGTGTLGNTTGAPGVLHKPLVTQQPSGAPLGRASQRAVRLAARVYPDAGPALARAAAASIDAHLAYLGSRD